MRIRPRIAIDCARPDGGPLTEADFDLLARIARAATPGTDPRGSAHPCRS
ncbi:hypothetical protein [Streptomyces sp. NPDC002078]